MLDLQAQVEKDPKKIAALFNAIARRYDRVNALLSFGLNKYWSRRCIQEILRKGAPESFVDLCGGTGEITRRLKRHCSLKRTVVVDFSAGMLEVGRKIASDIETIEANVCQVPLKSALFDCAAMAYGIRNVDDRPAALKEALRLLKPGGRFVILELTRPNNVLLRYGHRLHLKLFVPLLGKIATTRGSAYTYLSQSVEEFIEPARLQQELKEAGFKAIEAIPLSGGIAALFTATKPA